MWLAAKTWNVRAERFHLNTDVLAAVDTALLSRHLARSTRWPELSKKSLAPDESARRKTFEGNNVEMCVGSCSPGDAR